MSWSGRKQHPIAARAHRLSRRKAAPRRCDRSSPIRTHGGAVARRRFAARSFPPVPTACDGGAPGQKSQAEASGSGWGRQVSGAIAATGYEGGNCDHRCPSSRAERPGSGPGAPLLGRGHRLRLVRDEHLGDERWIELRPPSGNPVLVLSARSDRDTRSEVAEHLPHSMCSSPATTSSRPIAISPNDVFCSRRRRRKCRGGGGRCSKTRRGRDSR
jgi:hypothetical protein